MFLFAHVFAGALIGLGFLLVTKDRRAIPLCMVCAILPDLLDKPLALLFPGIFGSGRTLGHTLLFLCIIAVPAILLWHYRHTLLGMACACAVASHQVLDTLWNLPATWFWPLLGPFPAAVIPDYLMFSFWREITSASEWIFAFAALVILAGEYRAVFGPLKKVPVICGIVSMESVAALLLGLTAAAFLYCGLAAIPCVFFAPTYDAVTDMLAGLVAFCGCLVIAGCSRQTILFGTRS